MRLPKMCVWLWQCGCLGVWAPDAPRAGVPGDMALGAQNNAIESLLLRAFGTNPRSWREDKQAGKSAALRAQDVLCMFYLLSPKSPAVALSAPQNLGGFVFVPSV